VIHDRNPMFVRLSDGSLRNAYNVRIVNKRLQPREFSIGIAGLPMARIDLVGVPARADEQPVIEVGPDQTREVRVLVTDRGSAEQASRPIAFHLTDVATGEAAEARDHFFAPGRRSEDAHGHQ
jgi:polyferredoxin